MNTEQKCPTRIDISVVIPFYNEEESLAELYNKLVNVLMNTEQTFEIIFVDDGSTDNSYQVVKEIQESDPRVKLIKFKTNAGKARGLNEGFKKATGDIVFTMDADLQDDPEEIPNFLSKIKEGYDLVSGWKKERHDPLEKRLPSKLFNKVTSLVTGVKLHDFNCGFKAYRREILDEIKVYGELHRYIPALAHWQGYNVGEIPVKHHARKFGSSKYGWERYLRGFFDLFTVVLLTRFMQTPLYLFGLTGISLLILGLVILVFLTTLQIAYGSIMGHKPLSYLGVLSVLFGSQLVATGLIAEMLNNISAAREKGFSIKKLFNRDDGMKEIDISIVIPVHNESKNLRPLFKELDADLTSIGKNCEIILVDDGSTDGSFEIIEKDIYPVNNYVVKGIQLRKRFGKAAALQAGFDVACGNTVITMDGDLQDNPDYISQILNILDNGADMALGVRTGIPFPRSFFSKSFNRLVSLLTGVKIHDINCGLKGFRRNILESFQLYGQLQRFLPLITSKKGYKIVEFKVEHRERLHGRSKYGPGRIPKAFLDLLGVILLTDFRARPLHLFGLVGMAIGSVGFFINFYLTILKIQTGNIGDHYTLLLMGVILMILGLQWFSTGLIGEIINKLRHVEQNTD